MGMIKDAIALARPHQYTKNLFIFLPAFFAFRFHEPGLVGQAFIAFVAYSLVSSAVYIFNDWKDCEEDRQHPDKCRRPIAAGRIKASIAFGFGAVFLMAGGMLAFVNGPEVFYWIASYVVLNVAYSLKLKHFPIIDISVISTGFVIRLFVGAAATQVALSHWIIVMTFLLSLFLALAKRRDDVLIYLSTKQAMRKAIDGYNLKFLDSAMVMTASIVLMAYILWSISPEVAAKLASENVYLTAVFVVLGIMRYMQIAFVEEKSGNPSEVLLRDRFIQLILLGWVGSFAWILYG